MRAPRRGLETIRAIAALRVLARRATWPPRWLSCRSGCCCTAPAVPDLGARVYAGDRRRPARGPHRALAGTGTGQPVGYEVLATTGRCPRRMPGRRRWDVVVADEAQRIKNDDTELALVLKSLPRRRTWALTGTPVENRAEDAASILDFVAPGRLDRGEMMVGLRRVLGEVQLRRRRENGAARPVLKLGCTVEIILGPTQRAAYDLAEQMEIWLRSLGADVAIGHVLELILRLKQICNACRRAAPRPSATTCCAASPRWGGGREGAGVQPVRRRAVRRRHAGAPSGAVPPAAAGRRHAGGGARGRAGDLRRDPGRSVMVLSLRAGGIGLNLTAASAVFDFDRWWNPAVEAQAEDRAHRIGQSRLVRTFAYLCPGTIEQRIAEILAEKRALFADLLDDVANAALRRLDLLTCCAPSGCERPRAAQGPPPLPCPREDDCWRCGNPMRAGIEHGLSGAGAGGAGVAAARCIFPMPTDARGRLATGVVPYVERNGRAQAAGPKTRFFGGRRGGAVAPGRWPPLPLETAGAAPDRAGVGGRGKRSGGGLPTRPGGSPASGAGRSCRVGSGRVGSGRRGEWSPDGPGRTGVLCCGLGGKAVASARPGRRRGRFRAIERIAWMRRSIRVDQQRGQPIPAAVGGQALGIRRTVRRTARWRLGGMGWWGSRDEVSIDDVQCQGDCAAVTIRHVVLEGCWRRGDPPVWPTDGRRHRCRRQRPRPSACAPSVGRAGVTWDFLQPCTLSDAPGPTQVS